jgi:hypothetical protein
MEADWSVEVGADLPHIVVPWADDETGLHFVDLRAQPEAASELTEAADHPALLEALHLLNSGGSAVFTSKCDLWGVPPEEVDPLELDLDPTRPLVPALACYVDVLVRDPDAFSNFALQEAWLRRLCHTLRQTPLRGVRADLVLRPAGCNGREGFAVTLYITAAGQSDADVRAAFGRGLLLAAATLAAGGDRAEGSAHC